MKKTISLLLAAVMTLCIVFAAGIPTFAENETPPLPAPENLTWDGMTGKWDSVLIWEDPVYYAYYTVQLYQVTEETSTQVFSTYVYGATPSCDFSNQIVKNGYGSFYFTVSSYISSYKSETVTSGTAEFKADTAEAVPFPAPYVSSWYIYGDGGLSPRWSIKSENYAPDADYFFRVTLYKNDEAVKTVDVDKSKFEYNFTNSGDLPVDSDADYYIGVKMVPTETETRYTESVETKGKSSAINPTKLLKRELTNVSADVCRAGDDQIRFFASYTGAYGGYNRMYIRMKVTGENGDEKEWDAVYWSLSYVDGSNYSFTFSGENLNYTFRENDFVEWELYLAASYWSDEYANVSGSFTVQASVPHTVTFDAQGLAENTSVTVEDRKALSNLENVSQYYPKFDGYKLLGWSKEQKPMDEYTSDDTISIYNSVYEDMTLYAVVKPAIKEAEISIDAPVCGMQIDLSVCPYAYWLYKQTPLPVVTVPEDAPYAVDDYELNWYAYVTPEPDPEHPDEEPEPYLDLFSGTVKGGETYYTMFYLYMLTDEDNNYDTAFAKHEDMTVTAEGTSAEIDYDYSSFHYSEIYVRLAVTAVHDWTDWTDDAENPGVQKRCCKHCDATETREKPAHVLTPVPAKPATCTEDGNIAYYTCSHCSLLFADEKADNVIELKDTVIPATGHAWGAWTNADETNHTRVCGNDATHVETEAHKWKADDGTAVVKTYTCTECGAKKTDVRLGDVDKDGDITAADARLALRRAVDLETYAPGSYEFTACNVDKDSDVTAADARKILRAAVELEDPATW